MDFRPCWKHAATCRETERLGLGKGRLTALVRLSYLAPDIMGAVLKGRQPTELTATPLLTTIGERMQADTSAFMPLPPAPYDACHKVATRVSSLSLVRCRNNDYSVPTRYGSRNLGRTMGIMPTCNCSC
jgi:hypothetical protein